jgi:hypothetical protein
MITLIIGHAIRTSTPSKEYADDRLSIHLACNQFNYFTEEVTNE